MHELLAEHEPQAPRHPLPLRASPTTTPAISPTPRASASQPRELLRAIPGLELVEPAEWELCCGSAGIYNLIQPEAAGKLGARKAANLRRHRRGRDRRRQPGLRAADRRATSTVLRSTTR